nr:MAG TPA: hypothetical protein [Caudoviricetes sp.]
MNATGYVLVTFVSPLTCTLFIPCLYANSDVHTIPAVFSEICRCYFPKVSVMVTPATAINLS